MKSSARTKDRETERGMKEGGMAKSLELQKNRIGIRTCVLIFAMVIVSLAPTQAQEAGGTIVGTVTDPTGAAVANANMTIRNVATGVERTQPTNADAHSPIPNLLPPLYRIKHQSHTLP